jgi:hypothetical protein
MSNSDSSTNRAEKIRQRRTERVRKPGTNRTVRRGRKTAAPAPPPVLIRMGSLEAPARDTKKGKPARRRFDISLATTGAEMRLPSLPRIHLGWRLLSGLLVIMLSIALYTVWHLPMYRVSSVKIDGLKRLNSREINTVLGVIGKPVFALDQLKMQQDLRAAFPELSDVTIKVSIPANVWVVVEERQPVVTWKQDGKTIWVDAEGVSFPQRGAAGPTVVVEASDSPPGPGLASQSSSQPAVQQFMTPEFVTAILKLGVRAPKGTPLQFTREHGFGWKDERGWDVYFGMSVDDIEMKLSVYDAILKHLAAEDIQPTYVSVEYVHAPYYHVEP